MKEQSNRRSFLKRLGMGSLAAAAAPAIIRARSSHSRLRLAGVGVGGKGWTDLGESALGHDVVAICDIDERRLERAAGRYPGARKYTDWRKLLEQKDIDALTISTPDHMHAPISLQAMSLGKHVYTQKPLTHSVYEARALTRLAKEKGVVTQMGIQHHSPGPLEDGRPGDPGRRHRKSPGGAHLDQPSRDLLETGNATALRDRPGARPWSTGTCGWAWLPKGRMWTETSTIPFTGGAGGISAPALWETWAAI